MGNAMPLSRVNFRALGPGLGHLNVQVEGLGLRLQGSGLRTPV